MNYFFGCSHLKVTYEHWWVLISKKSNKGPWRNKKKKI